MVEEDIELDNLAEEAIQKRRNVKDILVEMKDTSELMIDLAYSALLTNSQDIADEVEDLEDVRLAPLAAQHEVRGLQVAVDQARAMSLLEDKIDAWHAAIDGGSNSDGKKTGPRPTSGAIKLKRVHLDVSAALPGLLSSP